MWLAAESLLRLLMLVAVLFVTWLAWSGVYEPLLLGLGLGSCLFVAWIVSRLQGDDHETTPIPVFLRCVLYVPWLLGEVVKSNLHVARVILFSPKEVRPRLLRVDCTQESDFAQVLYANSITLTPGTISLDVRDGHILVHALTQDTAEGLLDGSMDAKCTWVERG